MDYTTAITWCYTSDEYLTIKQYYQAPSMMEIFGKERSETSHSGFIAWLLGNPELTVGYDTPFYRFLCLLFRRARQQNNKEAIDRLSRVLLYGSFALEKLDIQRECQISGGEYGKGSLDIFIQSRISDNDVNIIIENKVGSSETIKRVKGKTLYQSDAYHIWLKSEKKSGVNLYVFLSPISILELEQMTEGERCQRCHCKDYIHICYQDILDNIIRPYLEKDDALGIAVSAKTRFQLEDYKKALGKPNKSETFNSIMAMTQEEQKMLIEFFDCNRELILASIEAKTTDPNLDADEDQREALYNIKHTLLQVSKQRKRFKYNGEGQYSMMEITQKFVRDLSEEKKKGADDIQRILNECRTMLLSADDYNTKSDNMKSRFTNIQLNGIEYYLQKGYAYNKTEKLKKPNFPIIMKKARELGIDINEVS